MNLSPKLLDVAHKKLFTKPSNFTILKNISFTRAAGISGI